MNSCTAEKLHLPRQECRETAAAEVSRLSSDTLENDAIKLELETKTAIKKKEDVIPGADPSLDAPDNSRSTEGNLKRPRTANEATRGDSEGSEGSSTPSVHEFDVSIGIPDVQGFMAKTSDIAQRSLDGNTKVGAVIVDPQTGHVISTGYNHMAGHSEEFQWTPMSADVSWLDSKYPYVVHAVVDAINNCETRSELRRDILITTLLPGDESAKQTVEAGIKCVWYRENKYPGQDFIIAGERILKANGVECKKMADT